MYGELTYLCDAGVNSHKKLLWRMKCSCGNETVAVASQVRSGKTRSCGHLKRAGNRRTHSRHGTRLYIAWMNVRQRCRNKNHPSYKNYGGRGIGYDPAWESFAIFSADVGDPPSDKHSLDRIDNSKGYAKDNVRWALRATQSRNTRQNVWVEIDGETKCLYDWCDEFGISAGAVYRRVGRGEDIISAITRPKAARFRTNSG